MEPPSSLFKYYQSSIIQCSAPHPFILFFFFYHILYLQIIYNYNSSAACAIPTVYIFLLVFVYRAPMMCIRNTYVVDMIICIPSDAILSAPNIAGCVVWVVWLIANTTCNNLVLLFPFVFSSGASVGSMRGA